MTGVSNKSEQIRQLARTGEPVAQIARTLNVSYQFAYNVCSKAGLLSKVSGTRSLPQMVAPKPSLTVARLLDAGFTHYGDWVISDPRLVLPAIPKLPGVYAFALDGVVQYLGVATRSLAQRLYGYVRPGPTQTTNQRVNEALLRLIVEGSSVAIYCATPPDFDWNGLPISGVAGLEIGLLRSFDLPWNITGSG
jgi:hypothetical protein